MRVGIVGAGLAGLVAGRDLAARGHDVVLFDKGRSPGGRLATRRIGGATVDHGAQFFTVRSEAFAARVHEWQLTGLVVEWCRGFGPAPDGYPRYRVTGGMNALAKELARPLDVRTSSRVFALRPTAAGATRPPWAIVTDDGAATDVDAAVVTCPVPQSFSLVVDSGATLPTVLRSTDYDRTLALLAVLDGPSAVPPPGGVQQPDDTFTFVADNEAKGLSDLPALTLHANPEWSAAWWDRPSDEAHAALRALATPWLGASAIVASQLKRWRFATPRAIWPDPCWVAEGVPPLVLAGDAFAGPRVEGAALSGAAAAAALTQ
jgi:predicted NAD/FAD-dependent oxidoreductase